ncbi:LUD domain-containing protein [Lewinella sp. 4G2]|uniref:LutC/YkgG family protein n=1 Tax=Lewinella sp. 4G2 TaxID=1803372 RepID=UPI0007B4C7E4|nr:LUD domain-containing protein [Lewinella sp. 4G2]OAV42763.1 hypothetical protein A3850_016115 [Lewinella sp. 4G2]
MSKQSILAAVRANKPADRPLPELPTYTPDPENDLAVFTASLGSSKGKVIPASTLDDYLREQFPDAKVIASTVPEVTGNVDLDAIKEPLELALVDVAIIGAQFAVAENGAMWVSERESIIRVLPFITQHLILIVEGDIVPTMHEAYRKIKIDDTGFGVFIAGPSKTADIEQSLVIGAHGPRSLAVVIK